MSFYILCKDKSRKSMWKERFKSLNKIDPEEFRLYFNEVKSNKFSKNVFQKDKIFISIASYRDDQCSSTVQNLSEMSDNPENLHILICQQNETSDSDCLAWCVYDEDHPACKANITHIERLSHKDARGPCWARWKIQQKWTGEEFYLQIDAHTRVTKGWDTTLKHQLSLCPSNKACLTQYPPEYNIVDKKNRKNKIQEKWNDKLRGSIYIEKFRDPDGFTRIQSDWTNKKPIIPFSSKGWAGGFSFSKSEFIIDNPYDKYTPFLFFGEEMDISIRAYTNGWDFYSPTVNCLFTNYNRDHRKTFWENKDQKSCEILSRFRLYVRLGYINENMIPEKYKFILKDRIPLGNVRSIEDYEKFSNIDIKSEKII